MCVCVCMCIYTYTIYKIYNIFNNKKKITSGLIEFQTPMYMRKCPEFSFHLSHRHAQKITVDTNSLE